MYRIDSQFDSRTPNSVTKLMSLLRNSIYRTAGRAAIRPAAMIPTPAVTPAPAFSAVSVAALLGEADTVEVTVPAGSVFVVVMPDTVSVIVLAAKVWVVVITPLVAPTLV